MDQHVVDGQALIGVAANIDVEFLDQDGDVTPATGTVTADVTRASGTAIATGAATTAHAAGYRYALSAANNTQLDVITIAWKDAGTARTTTRHEIVGGFYFTVAELRSFDESLKDAGRYPNDEVRRVRREVEAEFEGITGCAWVPRYQRVPLLRYGPSRARPPRVGTANAEVRAGLLDRNVVLVIHGRRTRCRRARLVGHRDPPRWGRVAARRGESGARSRTWLRPPRTRPQARSDAAGARYRLNMERNRNRDQAVRVTVDGATYEMADDDDIEQRQVMRVVRRHEKKAMTRGPL